MECGLPRGDEQDSGVHLLYIYSKGSQPGAILPPTGHLAISENMFWLSQLGERSATGIWWGEAMNAAKYS